MKCSLILLGVMFVGLAAARTVDIGNDAQKLGRADVRNIEEQIKADNENAEPEVSEEAVGNPEPEPEGESEERPEPESEESSPEPDASQEPQVSEESAESQEPQVSEESDESQEPQVSEESDESQEPQVSEESDESQEPQVSEESAESQEPQVSEESAESQEPQVSEESAESQEPQVSEESAESQESESSSESNESQEPESNSESAESQEPESSSESAESQESEESAESSGSEENNGPQLAGPCDEEVCRLPNCRCSSTNIPGGLAPRDTPQFVNINFRGVIFWETIENIREMIYNRYNSNGCKAGATLYLNHPDGDYGMVNELYNEQFEIALNSMVFPPSADQWLQASREHVAQNIGDQKAQVAFLANIPADKIKGVRNPRFQLLGNTSFDVMDEYDLLYDNSWETRDPQLVNSLWPYTLDYASTQDCPAPPCPSASFPGRWVLPALPWVGNGQYCSQVDFCGYYQLSQSEWFRIILSNFERHYLGNRAPFTISITQMFVFWQQELQHAIIDFLNLVSNLNDAFVVNNDEIIEWVKNPIPVNEYARRPCKEFERAPCSPQWCGPYAIPDITSDTDMRTCSACPRTYPWLGNPLGQ